MTPRTRIVVGTIVTLALAVGAGAATAGYVVANDADWTRAADRRIDREAERDAVRADVADQERHLRELGTSIGADPMPKHDEPIEYPNGTDDKVLGGDTAIGAFTDVFVDEGIVLQGVKVEAVDELPQRPEDTMPPRPRMPIRPVAGSRLVKVTLRVTNRSGDGADPACGIGSIFSTSAYTTSGTRAQVADTFSAVGTYPASCGAGLADGASGDIVLGVAMKKNQKLTALQFTHLGEGDSDDFAPLLVLDEPA